MGPSLAALLSLVILVDDPRAPMNEAMRAAASEVLGSAIDVRVEAASSRANTASVAPQPVAQTAEVVVRWNPEGTTALVRGSDPSLGFAERQVTFSTDDDPLERGRTLGYMIAALLPVQRAAPPPPIEPSPFPVETPEPMRSTSSPKVGPVPQAADWVASVSLYGLASVGVLDDGASTAFGGAAAATWRPAPAFGLSLRTEARAGSVSDAQATTLWLAGKVGASYRALHISAFSLWLRADLGLARESVTHYSSDDPAPVVRARLVPISNVGVELEARLSGALALVASIGTDLVWGTADVFVQEEERASLGIVRPTLTLGVAASL